MNPKTLALKYYLERTIPKGVIIGLVYPKNILNELIPAIAKEKGSKVVFVGHYKLAKTFVDVHEFGAKLSDAELILVEPEYFVKEGCLVDPSIRKELINRPIFGVGFAATGKPFSKSLDFIKLDKTITNLGVFDSNILVEELG